MMRYRLFGLALATVLTVSSAFAGTRASNTQIQAELQDKIYHTRVFDHGQVAVAFENGTATLTGTVDNLASKMDAERAAKKVDGVTRVVNDIQVHADDVTARQILEKARKEVVTYYAYGIFDHVQLSAENDKLTVSGQVTQPYKKTDLGNILARIRGVATLENDLEVLPVSTFDNNLRWAVARAIYGSPALSLYGNRAVPPIHIIVKNGHVTLEGAVGSKLDRQLAEFAARHAGLSFSVVNNLRVDRA